MLLRGHQNPFFNSKKKSGASVKIHSLFLQ
jgi:hypothetical protein